MWKDKYSQRQRIREIFSQEYRITAWNVSTGKLEFVVKLRSLSKAKQEFATIAKNNCFDRPIRLELVRWDKSSFRMLHMLLKSPSRGNCAHCENKAEFMTNSFAMCKEHALLYLGELNVS